MYALAAILILGGAGWLLSLRRRHVGIVDSMWSLMFLAAAFVYHATADPPTPRSAMVTIMVAAWALRLSSYIAWRNHGEPEDYRYRTIRANNEPGFQWKSLFIVFWLQGVLAWFISMPLLAAIHGANPLSWLDAAGVALWAVGMTFEAGGDYQLSRFRAAPENAGRVLDRGLWRYTRHPNYFGNFCIWWGFFLTAAAAGGWWTVLSPLVMTLLLLKVSGVALLEKTITDRRPAYAEYIRRTNAFFPGPPRD
ncbi:MAG: DUF1295 domain-containing protein [Proteobacteria bacterium]|nr:MAG: DUF1295 domain-containing protein [Pseudomonadota bacterium]